jgi:hypothetical protein
VLPLPPQELLLHLYHDVLGPYWAERRRLVEVGYRGIEPGVEHFGLVVRRELETQQEQTVDGLVSRQDAAQQCDLNCNIQGLNRVTSRQAGRGNLQAAARLARSPPPEISMAAGT